MSEPIIKKLLRILLIFIFVPLLSWNYSYTQNYNDKHIQQDTVYIEWVRYYIGPDSTWDEGKDIAVDKQGNVYVTGNSVDRSQFPHYCTVSKYNSNGDLQWTELYDGGAIYGADAIALALDPYSNVYVSGVSYSANTGPDYATVKYNMDGIEQWSVLYNGPDSSADRPSSLAIDDSGNAYVTGYSYGSDGASDVDYATVKYNTNGIERWVSRYNGPVDDSDHANAISVDDSGNVYVTGYSKGGISGTDYATVKYNLSGVEQWVTRYSNGDFNSDAAHGIVADDSGNVYVTGHSEGIGTGRDIATIKYNSQGIEQWVRRYTSPGQFDDDARLISINKSGNIYVVGDSWVDGSRKYYTVIKYNSKGEQQWVNIDNKGTPADMKIDKNGNIYVTGTSGINITSARYNTNGGTEWIAKYNGGFTYSNGANGIAFNDSGNVYVTGYSYIDWYQPALTTIKYSQSQISAIKIEKQTEQKNYLLYQNYPNPFNSSTQINYDLPYSGFVTLKIYDMLGQEVKVLINKQQTAGKYYINYNPNNQPSGIYFYQLAANSFSQIKRMLLLR